MTKARLCAWCLVACWALPAAVAAQVAYTTTTVNVRAGPDRRVPAHRPRGSRDSNDGVRLPRRLALVRRPGWTQPRLGLRELPRVPVSKRARSDPHVWTDARAADHHVLDRPVLGELLPRKAVVCESAVLGELLPRKAVVCESAVLGASAAAATSAAGKTTTAAAPDDSATKAPSAGAGTTAASTTACYATSARWWQTARWRSPARQPSTSGQGGRSTARRTGSPSRGPMT
jgi:hypothetical protein